MLEGYDRLPGKHCKIASTTGFSGCGRPYDVREVCNGIGSITTDDPCAYPSGGSTPDEVYATLTKPPNCHHQMGPLLRATGDNGLQTVRLDAL